MRWTVFADGPVAPADLSPEMIDLPPSAAAIPAPSGVRPLAEVVAAVERRALAAALEATGGNKARAARLLGIDRNTLKRKLAGEPASPTAGTPSPGTPPPSGAC